MKLRPVQLLLLLGSFTIITVGAEESSIGFNDFPPRKFEPRRYAQIWNKNPFVSEVTLQAGPTEKPQEWSKGLILRAVSRIQGKYVVHVEDTSLTKEKDPAKARNRYQRLVQDAPNASSGGLRIVRVKAHRDPHQVEVTVSKGDGSEAEEAVVKYDPKALVVKNTQPQRTPSQVPKPGAPTTTRRVILPPGTTSAAATSSPQRNVRGGRGSTSNAGGRRGGGDRGGFRGQGGGTRGSRGGNSSSRSTPQRRVVLPPGR